MARPDRADRWALAVVFLFFAALSLFGARYHTVEEVGTAERDGYAAQAAQLLAGELPHDPYRPLLYPLASAALTPLAGDTFTAARLLSNAAAAALAGLAWVFGRRLGGPRIGAAALASTMANPNVWILGQHASTDMLFAALAAAVLAGGFHYLEAPGPRIAGLTGLALGLASFTRANAIVLLPVLPLAFLLAPRDRRRGRHAMLFLGCFVAALLPHWALRQAAFGNPFHDENWKNLAFKLYGYPDWSYLDRVPFAGLAEIVASAPGKVVSGAFSELARFATGGAGQLFGTALHAVLVLAGIAWALRRRHRGALFLVVGMALFLAVTATTFFTWGRLLLFFLPMGYALAFFPFRDEEGAQFVLEPRRLLVPVAALAVGLLAVKTFTFRLPAFVANHPYPELAALRELDRIAPPGTALAATPPFLDRHLAHPYVAIPDAFGAEIARPELYFAKLRPLLEEKRAEFLVIGPLDLRDRPKALLAPPAPVPWLEPAGKRGEVMLWRVRLGDKEPRLPAS